jgi:hypothetical protein
MHATQNLDLGRWFTKSLHRGAGLAQASLKAGVGVGGTFQAVAGDRAVGPHTELEWTSGVDNPLSDIALSRFFTSLAEDDPFLLVVEDDLAGPDDPDWAQGSTAPVLDRPDSVVHAGKVLHRMWVEFSSPKAPTRTPYEPNSTGCCRMTSCVLSPTPLTSAFPGGRTVTKADSYATAVLADLEPSA